MHQSGQRLHADFFDWDYAFTFHKTNAQLLVMKYPSWSQHSCSFCSQYVQSNPLPWQPDMQWHVSVFLLQKQRDEASTMAN